MITVSALPTRNGSNSYADFKQELLKKHKIDLIYESEAIVTALTKYGFDINQKFKRDSLKKLRDELYELRGKHIRIFLYFNGNNFFILLHGFIKKSQETPLPQINKALEEIRKWKSSQKD